MTPPLQRLDDAAALCNEELTPLVPEGRYWQVTSEHLPSSLNGQPVDFTECFAVRQDALLGVGNHPEKLRWIGCCGASGTHGPNRICACGQEVGTERSDCMWPVAVYLDPQTVRPVKVEPESISESASTDL
jgi:hypothetical protein